MTWRFLKSKFPRSLNSSETTAKTEEIETAEAIGLKRMTVNSPELDAVLYALEAVQLARRTNL